MLVVLATQFMTKLKNLSQSNNFYRVIALLILMFSLAVTLLPNYESTYDIEDNSFLLFIEDFSIDGNKLSMTLDDNEKLIGTYYIKSEEEKEWLKNNLKFGQRLSVNGTLRIPSNNTVPNLFNYKRYLYFQKIYFILDIDNFEIINEYNNVFYKIKNWAYDHANNIVDNEYVYAYILGNTSALDQDVMNSYRTNGISHLFALSGLHVGIFSLILMKILKSLKVKDVFSYLFVFVVLLIFAFITGFSPSMLRAVLLFLLLGFNKIYNLNIKTINILYMVFIIVVLFNPFIIFQVGFLLSFIVTFFLILSSNLLQNKSYLSSLFLVSTVSFLSSIGFSIYFFGSINPIGIVLNLFFVPFVSFIVFPLTLIVYILPFLSSVLSCLTDLLETLSIFFNRFSFTIYFPKISILSVIVYYIFLMLFFKTRKIFSIVLLSVILVFWKVKPYFRSETLIYFIDVGQGDACLISTPYNSKTILIDTGGKISYKKEEWMEKKQNYKISIDTLIPFMRSLGINKLDYIFLTHGDYDHMGEAIDLVENFKVKKVIFNCGDFNKLEQSLIRVLDKKSIPYYSCIKELNIEGNKLYFLNNEDYGNENDNSSVIYTVLDNIKFLFMGDAGVVVEEELIRKYDLQDIDVLKVGHHGSKTSSSKNFIDETNPKYSIVSVGKNNRYGHPNDSVLDILDNSKVYRTDEDGSIMFKIKNNKLEIGTCPQ